MSERTGSSGPKPYRQVRTSTIFLRVPVADWPAVKRGLKTEFRAGTGPNKTQPWAIKMPTPVVAYAVSPRDGKHDAQLMVLEQSWLEPLGAISPESLEREGYKSLAEFRRYWFERERRRFQPTRNVLVYRVRPWDNGRDARYFADLILGRLYGEFLPDYLPEDEA